MSWYRKKKFVIKIAPKRSSHIFYQLHLLSKVTLAPVIDNKRERKKITKHAPEPIMANYQPQCIL